MCRITCSSCVYVVAVAAQSTKTGGGEERWMEGTASSTQRSGTGAGWGMQKRLVTDRVDDRTTCDVAPCSPIAWGMVNAVTKKVHQGHAESVNSKIQILKVRARGYRSRDRFRTAILFCCGKLDLLPRLPNSLQLHLPTKIAEDPKLLVVTIMSNPQG